MLEVHSRVNHQVSQQNVLVQVNQSTGYSLNKIEWLPYVELLFGIRRLTSWRLAYAL